MSAELIAKQDSWTVGRLLSWTEQFLRGHEVDEPRLSAELLLANALGCERINLYTRFEDVPHDEPLAKFREWVKKASRHTPIAYLIGHKEFFSLIFEVTPDVLIPRPESETLVEQAVKACQKRRPATKNCAAAPIQILDLGTGSGCIVITILTQLDNARGTATDISAAALEVAARNAERHNVTDRLTLVEANRLDLPAGVIPDGGFDLLVSNPPYVAESEMALLTPGVREHEPSIALTPGGDGLDFFRSIASDGPGLLQPDGSVMVEIGAGQNRSVQAIFARGHRFTHAGTYRSPSDPHERVMHFEKV